MKVVVGSSECCIRRSNEFVVPMILINSRANFVRLVPVRVVDVNFSRADANDRTSSRELSEQQDAM